MNYKIILFFIFIIAITANVNAEESHTLKLFLVNSANTTEMGDGHYEIYLYHYLSGDRIDTHVNFTPVCEFPVTTSDPTRGVIFIGDTDIPYGIYNTLVMHWYKLDDVPENVELLPIPVSENRIINFTDETKIYPIYLHEINGEPETFIMYDVAEKSLELAKESENLSRWAIFLSILSICITFYLNFKNKLQLHILSKIQKKYRRLLKKSDKF